MTITRTHPFGRSPFPRAAGVILMTCLAVAPALRAKAAGAPTATRPASRPAGAITLTQKERTTLAAVGDYTDTLDEAARYVLLAVAARAPRLGPNQWRAELDAPDYADLLRRPGRYRAAAIRMNLHVHRVRKLLPGSGMGFSQWWPRDRPVWQMDCTWADGPHAERKPLIAFCLVDPATHLGRCDQVDARGQMTYKRGPTAGAAALFYKIYRHRDLRGRPRDYPVVVIWQMGPVVAAPPRGRPPARASKPPMPEPPVPSALPVIGWVLAVTFGIVAIFALAVIMVVRARRRD